MAGVARPDVSYEDLYGHSVEFMREVARYAEDPGITVGREYVE